MVPDEWSEEVSQYRSTNMRSYLVTMRLAHALDSFAKAEGIDTLDVLIRARHLASLYIDGMALPDTPVKLVDQHGGR